MTLKQLVKDIEKANELAERYNFAQRHEARVYEDEHLMGERCLFTSVKELKRVVKETYVPEAINPILECELKPVQDTHGTLWEGECTIELDERIAPYIKEPIIKKMTLKIITIRFIVVLILYLLFGLS